MKPAFVGALSAASAMSAETHRSGRSGKAVPGHNKNGSKARYKADRARRRRKRRQHAGCRVSHGFGTMFKPVWTGPKTGVKMLRPKFLGRPATLTPDETEFARRIPKKGRKKD